MIRRITFLTIILLGLFIGTSYSVMLIGTQANIIFSKDSISKNVIKSSDFIVTDEGLESTNEYHPNYELSLQTEKISAGKGWRPPRSLYLAVAINGSIDNKPIKKDFVVGQSFLVYVRYGCDGVHWSDWIFVPQNNDITDRWKKEYQYITVLGVPSMKYQLYDSMMSNWEKTNPSLKSDDDAFCHWLIKNKPDFFEKELPFIGYLQFYIDCNQASGKLKITSLSIEKNYGLGGSTPIPSNPKPVWDFEISQQKDNNK